MTKESADKSTVSVSGFFNALVSPRVTPQHARPPKERSKRAQIAREVGIIVVLAAILVIIIRVFVVQVYKIPSQSMQETLEVGTRISVNRVPVWGKSVQRGDVVVFQDTMGWMSEGEPQQGQAGQALSKALGVVPKGGNQMIVKRVIGVEGDTVTCCDAQGRVSVNGVPVDEEYVMQLPGSEPAEFEVVVPEDSYWVMGDNRSNSADSLYHWSNGGNGFVPRSSLVGKADFVIWPVSEWKTLGERDVFGLVGSDG